MNKRNSEKVKGLASLGVFTSGEAKKLVSISQPTLYRLEKEGVIDKVARGLFVHPSANIDYEHLDYIIACKTMGQKSVIGGLSALSHYNLIEQVPQAIWIITPPSKTRSATHKKYRLIRTTLSLEVEVIKQEQFKIVTLERALVEGLKHESKMGQGLVFAAIKKSLQNQNTTEDRLLKCARKLKIMNILEKKWELIIA